ncbi:MAG: hypothetical protein Q8L79_06805 [Methylobacter sp.]|nr:hypothetical protein [Methylobacter sp.]MDP1664823.1 hypothetical protein [Methylobacter sp.]
MNLIFKGKVILLAAILAEPIFATPSFFALISPALIYVMLIFPVRMSPVVISLALPLPKQHSISYKLPTAQNSLAQNSSVPTLLRQF